MKQTKVFIPLLFTLVATLTSCRYGNGSIWDENKAAGSYKNNIQSLWDQSRQNESQEQLPMQQEEDFVALQDEDLRTGLIDEAIPQPKLSPGEQNSPIPGIEAFRSPTGQELSVFKNVHFNTDDHIIREEQDIAVLDKVAAYLKAHKDVYLFVSGHCDERGPEAYNLALGARRANMIRSMLVQRGVDPEHIHTVSYGKERPSILGHTAAAWAKNRRGEFRIYQK